MDASETEAMMEFTTSCKLFGRIVATAFLSQGGDAETAIAFCEAAAPRAHPLAPFNTPTLAAQSIREAQAAIEEAK